MSQDPLMPISKKKRVALSTIKKAQLENRKCLADATTRYFEQLDTAAMAQENALAKDLMSCTNMIDFDKDS